MKITEVRAHALAIPLAEALFTAHETWDLTDPARPVRRGSIGPLVWLWQVRSERRVTATP